MLYVLIGARHLFSLGSRARDGIAKALCHDSKIIIRHPFSKPSGYDRSSPDILCLQAASSLNTKPLHNSFFSRLICLWKRTQEPWRMEPKSTYSRSPVLKLNSSPASSVSIWLKRKWSIDPSQNDKDLLETCSLSSALYTNPSPTL